MASGDKAESNSSGDPDFQLGMGSVPAPETPASLNDTVFLSDGTPGSGNVEFVLNPGLDNLPLPNRFCVERMLGKGGFGCVYLATDKVLHRVVAIKVPYRLSDESEELHDQFLKESRAAARLNHPSIVRVLDSGESDGISWQVAEFVDGPRLSDFRAEQGGTLPVRSAALIISQLADAVQHAHHNGVLHRDIKPENILMEKISQQSEENGTVATTIPRLTDFGLARLADDNIAASRSGIVVGTPKYMAPEQLQGKSSMQAEWTDIYSLGVVLYELLTGAIPFSEAVDLNSRIAVSEQRVPSFRDSRPEISRDLETICLKCLHSRPQDRYSSAAALRDDLRRFLEGLPTLARPLSGAERLARWAGKNRLLATLISLLSIAIVTVFLQLFSNLNHNREQNRNLQKSNELLQSEQQRSDTLLELTEKSRIHAEYRESEYRTLAWNSSLRESLTSLAQKKYFSTWQLLESLRHSQPENIHRPEWQLTTQELHRHYEPVFDAGHPLYELTMIPGTMLMAVAGESYRIDLIDTQTFQPAGSVLTDIQEIHALAVSPDGKRIAVGGSVDDVNQSVPMIYSLETGKPLQSLAPQVTTIESLMFSPDGKYLICGSRYQPVRIFNLANDTERQVETKRRNQWLLTSPDGAEFAAFATSHSIVVSPFDNPTSPRLVSTQSDIQFSAWIPESRIVVCTDYQSEYILLINIDTGQHVGKFLNSGKDFSLITVSGPQRLIFAGCVDGSIAVAQIPERWLQTPTEQSGIEIRDKSVEELPITQILQCDNQTITGMVISDNVLYCSSAGGRVSKIRFPYQDSGSSSPTLNREPWRSAAISRNGDILIGNTDGTIVKLNASFTRSSNLSRASFSDAMANGEISTVARDDSVIDEIAVSPDGQYFGWSNWTEQVQIQERSTSKKRTLAPQIQPALGSIEAICFSPDSQWIAWIGKDRLLSTSRISEASALQTTLLSDDVRTLQYSPDSLRLACGSRADQLKIISSDTLTTSTTLSNCSGCTAIKWHASRKSLLLGFRSGSIQIRNLSDGDSIQRSYVHRNEVRDIALSRDGKLAASVDDSGQVAMWDAETGGIFGVLFEPTFTTRSSIQMSPALQFLDSGELILVYGDGTNDPQILRWQSVATHD